MRFQRYELEKSDQTPTMQVTEVHFLLARAGAVGPRTLALNRLRGRLVPPLVVPVGIFPTELHLPLAGSQDLLVEPTLGNLAGSALAE